MAQLSEAKVELAKLQAELAQYGECDPAKVDEKKRAVILAKEAAIRWTGACLFCGPEKTLNAVSDNYAILLSHFTRQHGVDPEEIRKYLGVGEDYEDIL